MRRLNILTDEMQNDDLDQSFWDDVDALRAMLEEEDAQQQKPQIPSFDLDRSAVSRGSRQESPAVIQRAERTASPVPADRKFPQQRAASCGTSIPRQARAPRRPSRGALITLYTIILLELGAISAVAYHWYSWIQ